MNRQIVCVESPDFLVTELASIAVGQGDTVVALSKDGRFEDGVPVVRADVRGDLHGAITGLKEAGIAPDAVITGQEMFLTHTAALADAFGVARVPSAAVASARDKALMKRAWLSAGVPTPLGRHDRVTTDIAHLTEGMEYPLIVKPTMGYASCGVRRVDSPSELREQIRNVQILNATVVAREGTRRSDLLIEEYIDGPEFSVDTVWFDGEPLCDGVLSKGQLPGPFFPDRLYYVDPHLPATSRSAIVDVSHRAARALGITHGATHTEIRFRGDEPYVLETTNRPGAGGLFYGLFAAAYGVDFYGAYYHAAVATGVEQLRRQVNVEAVRAPQDGEYFFWYNIPSRGTGVIREIRGVDRLAARPEITRCLSYKQPGAMLYPPGLEVDYFCSVLGRYIRQAGSPPLETFVTGYDDALEVIL
ncbi:ATP-grasp domain-containing protein [Actinoplanes philippinensis]|uniref:ATP-grasp domain-containing protein n=1 Tax=Actinoplanes philippinensis TaxID=35752 RepID=UPI003405E29E